LGPGTQSGKASIAWLVEPERLRLPKPLTFTGPARFQYELDADGKIKVNPDGTITVL
jgi:hypothetical protein